MFIQIIRTMRAAIAVFTFQILKSSLTSPLLDKILKGFVLYCPKCWRMRQYITWRNVERYQLSSLLRVAPSSQVCLIIIKAPAVPMEIILLTWKRPSDLNNHSESVDDCRVWASVAYLGTLLQNYTIPPVQNFTLGGQKAAASVNNNEDDYYYKESWNNLPLNWTWEHGYYEIICKASPTLSVPPEVFLTHCIL